MRNVKLIIEYDGTCYAGWQEQKDQITIQGTLKAAIEKVVREKITLYGAGRTDAGVHALGQTANFNTISQIPSNRFPFAINSHLPPDIIVKSAQEVDAAFNARFSAKWKVYQYSVHNDRIPPAINRNFCYTFGFPLNIIDMKKGAELLIGEHDFGAFRIAQISGQNNVRILKRFEISCNGKYVDFLLEGNAFLHGMARRLVGTLIELGRGKIAIDKLKDILISKDPRLAGPTMPAKGLCLMEVRY